ncbi:MAG TPA: hypothetical protein VKF82_02790 [Candidatus Eremiobacteraceae bacterium]|nr:hypothetical protein [Candidatus Eremiobacteraceae bacterium]
MSSLRILAFSALLALVGTASVCAAPTPAPGGANQVDAISGKVGDTLWNGVLRFKVVEVRDATPADHPESVVPGPTQKVMVVTAIIRNGTPSSWGELVSYTLADKDDISFEIPGHFFTPVALNIQQGASVKQTALFPVDKTYVPTKLIFQCNSCAKGKFKPFRVTIPAPAS